MPIDDSGKTAYQPYDYDSAIRDRLNVVDQIGQAQNNYVAEAAQRRLAMQQADQQAQWAAASQQSSEIGANNTSRMSGGGTGSFKGFMNAISSQESGNNYGARNSLSGAMGKYQIMPSNIMGVGTGWDKEALGYDINIAQFMNSPQIQEKIATYKLQQYYNKYGPAGAAIAWYAGPGAAQNYVRSGAASTHGEAGGHPSVSAYMQSILRKMGLA